MHNDAIDEVNFQLAFGLRHLLRNTFIFWLASPRALTPQSQRAVANTNCSARRVAVVTLAQKLKQSLEPSVSRSAPVRLHFFLEAFFFAFSRKRGQK